MSNFSSGNKYIMSDLSVLFDCETTRRNESYQSSMSMGLGYLTCALGRTVLAFPTMVLMYLSAIPFLVMCTHSTIYDALIVFSEFSSEFSIFGYIIVTSKGF